MSDASLFHSSYVAKGFKQGDHLTPLQAGILRIWCDLRLAVLGSNDLTEVLMLDGIIICTLNITTGIEIFTMLIFQINGPFLPSEAPLPLLLMDELICLGCGKSFNSQRCLSAHETLCNTHHEFSAQVSKSHRHAEKSRRNKKRKRDRREEANPLEDVGDMDTGNWDIQDADVAGGSEGSHPHSPPIPEVPPLHSNRSGHIIRMPR
ncbi:hypothetical protein EDB19DRAFT_1835877 [Suillus lakei]|nr:hypothetical protein EDB19DRAFT_1835877 [Suillus lakei]